MIKYIFIFGIFLIINEVYSINLKDTVQKATNNIIVTAGRIKEDNFNNFNPDVLISDTLIQKLNINNIGEILSISPGIFLKDYGGIGGLKTISFRGTSASQNKVLLNGIELNTSQNGTFDLSLLPESMINAIETVRGGMSVMYGSNAIGGVVNILTDDKSIFETKLSYGSYNDITANLKTTSNISKFKISSNIDYRHSDGDFEFYTNQFGERKKVNRTNSEINLLTATLNTKYNFKSSDLALFVLASYSDRGIPGSVIQGRIENTLAKMKENNILGALSYNVNSNYYTLSNSISFKLANIDYTDPYQIGIDGNILNSDFKSNDIKFTSIFDFNYLFNHKILIDLGLSNLRSPFLDNNDNYVNRDNISIAYNISKAFKFIDNNYLSIFAGMRMDYFTNTQNGVSPAIGLDYYLNSLNTNILFSLSSNYRVPSFNEMYYLNYGTKDLLPENSLTYNFTIKNHIFDFLKVNISFFAINTKNLIQSIPISPIRWSAKNIGQSLNYGIEFYSDITILNKYINLIVNYTLQKPLDKTENSDFYNKIIAYQPLEMLNAYLFFTIDNLNINISSQYTSYRYSLQSNDINSLLPSYIIYNSGLSYQFDYNKINLILQFSVKNLLDNRYEVIKNYPMPGRIYKFSVIFKQL